MITMGERKIINMHFKEEKEDIFISNATQKSKIKISLYNTVKKYVQI